MQRVLLIHAGLIPHYRVPIYDYLSKYLADYGFELTVISDGFERSAPNFASFTHVPMHLSTLSIARFIQRKKIDIVISFMGLRRPYLLPTFFTIKGILRRKIIYWGHGRDLLDMDNMIKNIGYLTLHLIFDAILLYAEHLKIYLPKCFHTKCFVANNTLILTYNGLPPGMTREKVLAKYSINTRKNIICIGRMQERKKIDHLVKAFIHMNRADVGLIFVGTDDDGVLRGISGNNIYKLGPLYGDEKYALLSSVDICCIPGAVGLSIVDALFCGLPFVSEKCFESAEIMYLKDGVNGFIVPKGDTALLSQKMELLLDNDKLRQQFSVAAKREIEENASMDKFCSGFRDALSYVTGQTRHGSS